MPVRKRVVLIGVTISVLVLLSTSTVAYHFSKASPLQLIVEMNPRDSSPILQWVSRQALYFAHPTPEEIKSLNEEAGARYMATFPDSAEAEKLLKHFLAHGLDINSKDQASGIGLTALQEVALEGKPAPVQLLLKYGANVNTRDTKGRTALDLVRESQRNRPDADFSQVIRTLAAATAQSQ